MSVRILESLRAKKFAGEKSVGEKSDEAVREKVCG